MKKILLSLLTIGAVSALGFGATRAYFSDTETSEGNTFIAGALDLKVDSTAHYDGMVCSSDGLWIEEDDNSSTYPKLLGKKCSGTWSETDITSGNDYRFFDFADLKPGDSGEITLSLHVYNNDAWGNSSINVTRNLDDNDGDISLTDLNDYDDPYGMTEPEDMVDGTLNNSDGTSGGDLGDYIMVTAWEDFGTDGLPGTNDSDGTEGDNIHQSNEVWIQSTPVSLSTLLSSNPYFIDFGKLLGDKTYHYGIAWEIPADTGNIIQSDSYVADINFQIQQVRHNASPTWPLPSPTP